LLLVEIRWELTSGKEGTSRNYVLNDLSWSGQFLWAAIAPGLRDIIANDDPENPEDLRPVLKILQGSPLPDGDIASLAAEKVRGSGQAALWFAVWMGVDPEAALPALKGRLASISSAEEASAFADELCGAARWRPIVPSLEHSRCVPDT
jgi:hypothetical protein